MLLFMEKPSRKLYPDYYEVIQEPMDMLTIESNIRADKYSSEEELMSDFQVLLDLIFLQTMIYICSIVLKIKLHFR